MVIELFKRVKLLPLNLESLKQVNRSAYHRDEILFAEKALILRADHFQTTLPAQAVAVIPAAINISIDPAVKSKKNSLENLGYLLSFGEGYRTLIEETYQILTDAPALFTQLNKATFPAQQWLLLRSILTALRQQQTDTATIAERKLLFHFASILYLKAYQAIMEPEEIAPSNQQEREHVAKLIRDYIDSHLTENLTLSQVAQEFAISESTANRLFHEFFSDTIHQHLLKKRLEHASQLLKQQYSVSESWQAAGFKDYSNFYRAFKKLYGHSPSNHLDSR